MRRTAALLAALLTVPALAVPAAVPASAAPAAAPVVKGCTIKPGTKCPNAKLRNAKLRNAKLRKADLRNADLRGANLRNADLRGANLRNTRLRNTNLRGADLRETTVKKTDLRGANLATANLRGLDLASAKMQNTNLQSTNLRETTMRKLSIPRARMAGANLRGADLTKASMAGATATNTNFGSADLSGMNLSGANLSGANLQGSDLQNTNLATANLSNASFGNNLWQGSNITGATFTNAAATTYVLPEQGQQIVNSINSAQNTVDIVIYEIGGPNIVGQAGAPGALMNAVARGVDVRIIVNGQWYNPACFANTAQSKCADFYKLSWIYATQASLQAAAAGVPNPGTVQLNFANNNFQVTHQKTVIIDAADPATGLPLPATSLPPTARVLVSTGNLLSFGWSSKSITNPIEGCTQNNCVEWSARDFFVDLTETNLIGEIENVFFSDLYCGAVPPGTTPSTTNTNNLLATPLPLTWSNGSTWPQNGTVAYPSPQTGYPFTPVTGTVIQGNARQRTLDLINSARSSLLVYNEEMNDTETIAALVAKSKQLGPGAVKVVMTMNSEWWNAWYQLSQAGAQIRISQADVSENSTQLYIHGKVIIADQTDVFLGSENISFASLNFNRELGLMMTTRKNPAAMWLESVQGVQTLVNTFYTDFNTNNFLDWQVTPVPDTPATTASTPAGNFPMLCGPIPQPS